MDEKPSAPSLPTVGTLMGETLQDFGRDPAGWLLAGLGFTVVLYALPFVAFVIAAMLFMPIAILPDRVVVDSLGVVVVPIAVIVAMIGIGPFLASLYRAFWKAQHGEEPLGIASAFAFAGADLASVLVTSLVVGAIVTAGSLICGLPGIAAAWLLGWSLPAVFLHHRQLGDALSASVAHVREHPWWNLGLIAVALLVIVVIGALPIVGPILGIPVWVGLHTRAFRVAFGEAPPERFLPPPEEEEEREPLRGPRIETYDV